MKEDFKLPWSQVVVKSIHLDENQAQSKPNNFQYQVSFKKIFSGIDTIIKQ